ncbi:MAG: thioredoxin [Kiritimatiellae bacterium]|nr:thioredoxin [Kiritimatiellia bacterium]
MVEIIEANDSNFSEIVSTGKVLVDFNAEWCGPCKMMGAILEQQVAPKVDGVKIVSVNVDQSPRTAALYQIQSIPTLIFVKDGNLVQTLIGVQKAQDVIDLING